MTEEQKKRSNERNRAWRARNRDRSREVSRAAYERRRDRQVQAVKERIAIGSAPAIERSQLSRELQQGKAAEHLVVFDLIMQGYSAFLADQGMPFDVVVVTQAGALKRVQVKSTAKQIQTGKNHTPHYRFNLRRGVGTRRRFSCDDVDVVALVALDVRKVAYLPVAAVTSPTKGGLVGCADFYLNSQELHGRSYVSGHVRKRWGRRLDDYSTYPV